MGNDSNPKRLTQSGTTTLGSVMLYGVCVNKTLTGTMTIYEGGAVGGTLIAVYTTSATPNTYQLAPNGTRYTNLAIVLSTTDDVNVLTRAV